MRRLQSPATKSTSRPNLRATARQPEAKKPWSNINTLSPGDSVLTSAASHPPFADPG